MMGRKDPAEQILPHLENFVPFHFGPLFFQLRFKDSD